ncbi:MAG: hypothetical protein RLZZ501_2485 [Pseudomonadota bacterium]|jgi:hypothetical protein
MSHSDPQDAIRAFETKAASLIAATRSLDIPRILTLRRMTLADSQSRRWASEKQLTVLFSVILTKAAERYGLDALKTARTRGFAPLLAGEGDGRDEDLRVLGEIATQLLGPPERDAAEEALAGFQALLSRGFAPVPPRSARVQAAGREPPPLFAAQLGPMGDRRAPRAHPPEESGVDFAVLFDETLCSYVQKTLSVFRVTSPTHGIRLPFLVAPEFGPVYRELMRRFILPQMRATRHIQALAQSCNWAEVGGARLIELIQGSEVNNPILHNWEARWAAFRPAKPAAAARGRKSADDDNPWPLLREEATRCNFLPPGEDDLPLLRDILRFEAEEIARCWRDLGQLYAQEFPADGRNEPGREGVMRDGLLRWFPKLPDHVGEHLAIKAVFEFERIDAAWLNRLFGGLGRSDSERRRVAPYLADFLTELM